jgi:copper transport protein
VVVISGGLRLLAHLDDPRALVGTGWGRVLLVKLAAIGLLLAVGHLAGRRLRAWRADPWSGRPAVLRRLVGAELLLAGLVLALSAALANLSPALPPAGG